MTDDDITFIAVDPLQHTYVWWIRVIAIASKPFVPISITTVVLVIFSSHQYYQPKRWFKDHLDVVFPTSTN